jgi:molybdenum cofactor cytidylyltransferase
VNLWLFFFYFVFEVNSSLDTEILTDTALVVLAAGYSSRMGSPKALLKFDEDHDFIQKIVSVFAEAGLRKMVVVVNSANVAGIAASLQAAGVVKADVVVNEHPERERFYSIQCGLAAVEGYGRCFIHNCDNPFVPADIIHQMMNVFEKDAVTVPEFRGERGHPVLLPRNIMQAVVAHPENNCNFKSFLSNYTTKTISVDDNSILLNINSREDLQNLLPNMM